MGRALDPILQARVRQLLGLRGGPPIEAEEVVLPVAIVGTWPDSRQPHLEAGETIGRKFWACAEEVVAIAGQRARVGIRSGDVNAMLWIYRLWMHTHDGTTTLVRVGRTATWAFNKVYVAGYLDFRLPTSDLNPTPIDMGSAEFAGAGVTFRASLILPIQGTGGGNPQPLDVDFVLTTDGVAPEVLTIEMVSADRDLIVGVEGISFPYTR